jgi:hypothetical protein
MSESVFRRRLSSLDTSTLCRIPTLPLFGADIELLFGHRANEAPLSNIKIIHEKIEEAAQAYAFADITFSRGLWSGNNGVSLAQIQR